MILRQFLHTGPVGISYLFGCGGKAAGAMVDPAFSGSICGRRLSGKPWSTIGFERRHNQAFGINDESEFVSTLLRDVPRSPIDAARIRAVNAGLAGAE
jgi:hypothetical protein